MRHPRPHPLLPWLATLAATLLTALPAAQA